MCCVFSVLDAYFSSELISTLACLRSQSLLSIIDTHLAEQATSTAATQHAIQQLMLVQQQRIQAEKEAAAGAVQTPKQKKPVSGSMSVGGHEL